MKKIIFLAFLCLAITTPAWAFTIWTPKAPNGDSLVIGLNRNGTTDTTGYGWLTDPNTGIIRLGADSLGFVTGGVVRFTVGATGRIRFVNAVLVDSLLGNTIANSWTLTPLTNSTGRIGSFSKHFQSLNGDTANIDVVSSRSTFLKGLNSSDSLIVSSGNFRVGTSSFIVNATKVGIGTITPAQLLQVSDASTPFVQITDTTTPTTLSLVSDNTTGIIRTETNHDLLLGANQLEWMRIKAAGNVLVNKTAADGTEQFSVTVADNGVASTFKVNAVQANVTAADVFTEYRSTTGVEGNVAGTSVAGVIAYNTFTGAHYAQFQNEAEADSVAIGMIVSMTDQVMPGGDYLPFIRRSVGRNDKTVYGVCAGKIADGSSQSQIDTYKNQQLLIEVARILRAKCDSLLSCKTASDSTMAKVFSDSATKITPSEKSLIRTKGKSLNFAKGSPLKSTHQVFAVGTGVILVTDTGGSIDVGDLISPSFRKGLGERQTIGNLGVTSDDVVRSFTVAKSSVNVDWNTVVADIDGMKRKLIPCVYK